MFKWLIILIFSYNAAAQTINRNVLVLWDSAEHETQDIEQSVTHTKLEVILNHYGLIAHYLDVNNKIPKKYFKKSVIKNYVGMITWFTDPASLNPNELIRLHKTWLKLRKKTIVLGNFGFLFNLKKQNTPIDKVNYLLKDWGVRISGREFQNPLVLGISQIDKNAEYERKLNNELGNVLQLTSVNKGNKSLLTIKDKVNNQQTHPIIHNDLFFYAHYGYELYRSNYNSVTQWRLNPYYLINWLIDNKYPIPDTTTLFGKRIMYSHIDGDAFISISEVDRKSLCGEIIRTNIIDKFKVPISVSLVMAEIDPKYRGNKRVLKLAQDFFKSPHIEPASHTYFHPLSWDKQPSPFDIEIYFGKKKNKYIGGPIVAYKYPDYFELDYNRELNDSTNYLNSKILKNKKSKLLFWSGSCRPPKEALKIAHENKLLNMNGGDSRFDRRFNSVSHLYPLGKQVGKYLQVYSSNSNENTYTNLWEGPFVGFKDVIETFKNTEYPIRLKPINIYYHFYSGEKISSLKALTDVYTWSLKQSVMPIFTSDYIKIVKNYYDIQITKINNSTFNLSNIKNLTTFRYDSIIFPNYKTSKNIIGHKHINGSTYIHLNDQSKAKLTFKTRKPVKTQMYIDSSEGIITKFSRRKNNIVFNFDAHYGNKVTVYIGTHRIKNQKNFKKVLFKDSLAEIELISKNEKVVLEIQK